jgi:tripartite-type tricarboxylate transporter receptor subunit TctC
MTRIKKPIKILTIIMTLTATIQSNAQTWPDRPVRIVNPFAAGAASDVVARLIAEKLTRKLDKSFVVDNRPGANAIIGTEIVSKAAPDGYTVLSGGNTTHAANPSLYQSIPYDPIKDFSPVAFIVGLHYYLVVSPNFPGNNVKDLVNYAKSNPEKITYGTGNATSTISAELFNLTTGTQFAQVSYKGNPLAITDVISGNLTTMFLDNSTARGLIQAGKLKALGIAALNRSEIFPDIATLTESGVPGINLTAWIALWFPAKTPQYIVQKMNTEVNAARALPDVTHKLKELGFTLEGSGPSVQQFTEFIKSEIALWARVVKEAKIVKQ